MVTVRDCAFESTGLLELKDVINQPRGRCEWKIETGHSVLPSAVVVEDDARYLPPFTDPGAVADRQGPYIVYSHHITIINPPRLVTVSSLTTDEKSTHSSQC